MKDHPAGCDYPLIPLDDIPPQESDEAIFLQLALSDLPKYVEDFRSALDLFDFAAAEQRKIGEIGIKSKYANWRMIAARDGALSIFHFGKTIEGIMAAIGRYPALLDKVDTSKFRSARKLLRVHFPYFEAVQTSQAARGRLMLAAGIFALGLVTGVVLAPSLAGHLGAAAPASAAVPNPVETRGSRAAMPAQVVRVIDGDTFEARVNVWPGMDITTKVRLRGIDAADLRARCPEERAKAESARDALAVLLAEGGVGVSLVTHDKYGGRVLANASTRKTADVSTTLLQAGLVRAYAGGKRESLCESRGQRTDDGGQISGDR